MIENAGLLTEHVELQGVLPGSVGDEGVLSPAGEVLLGVGHRSNVVQDGGGGVGGGDLRRGRG